MTPTTPVSSLRGLGTAAAESLASHGIRAVGDLPWVLPAGWDDLRAPLSVTEALARGPGPERVAVRGVVRSATMARLRGRPSVRVTVADAEPDAGGRARSLAAFWFFAAHGVLAAAKPGREVLLAGRLSATRAGGVAMAHPELLGADAIALAVRPRYPRLGVPPARLAGAIQGALERLDEVPDPVPPDVAAREGMPAVRPLLLEVHRPAAPPAEATLAAVRERLAWGEAFARVWERTRSEEAAFGLAALALPPAPAVVERLRVELGFAWTAGQRAAIDAVAADLATARPMRRLLFGDVGAGKTAVAFAAAAQAVAAGAQVAVLAPTTVLAEQYLEAAGPLARAAGARVAQVTAATKAAERRHLAKAIADGLVDVVIGTHALLAEDLVFRRLALVVVDEQQRLGVAQRLSLVKKGQGGAEAIRPHLLTLSATPIPRTLALALRGDLATSELADKPAGRSAPRTTRVARAAFDDVVLPAIRAAIEAGGRAFVVCPRIDAQDGEDGGDGRDGENGGNDRASEAAPSCVDRAAQLAAALGEGRVVLVHGRLRPAAAAAAVRAFRTGASPVLVGTTVVEVGLDVPEATLMVIDGAEHFGLAQLHQLRGRVGRGAAPGRCLLVHDAPLAPVAGARLDALCRLASGLELAREDLRLRGAGDLSGTRQSGADGLVWLDPRDEPAWLARVEGDVARIRRDDPALARAEHLGLRMAMERLGRAGAVGAEAG